jgi:hypothetical protein
MSGWNLVWILAAVALAGVVVLVCECRICHRERTGVEKD